MGVRGQLEHLDSPEATNEDVRIYLEERSEYITGAGGVAIPIDQFWAEGDLDRYRQAAAIWAKDAPPRFALPDLSTMLNAVAGPAGMMQTSFMHNLTHLWEGYAAWMQSEGRDPLRPEEDAKSRRARIARESMQRTRAARAGTDPKAAELKRLHGVYMDACRKRKEVTATLDAEVRAAWGAYEAAKG